MDDDRAPQGELRPGDQLVVSIVSVGGSAGQQRERTAQVDARGDLHAASARDVHVAGLGIGQAEERVAEAVHASEKHAEVSLRLLQPTTSRVSVLGALRRPGYFTLAPGMRLVDVVATAGGILTTSVPGSSQVPVADVEGAALLRDGRALPIRLSEALRGNPRHNVYLYPGDQLYVPLATDRTVSVLGQVRSPGVFAHRRGMRLTEALATSGGITTGGDKTDIRILRGPVAGPKVYRSSLRAIADGREHDAVLAPGDVLFVQDHPAEDFNEILRVLMPLASVGFLLVTVLAITSL